MNLKSDAPTKTQGTKQKKKSVKDIRTELSRAKILQTTWELLAECGYQRTSLNKIAAHAGYSRELPRYHFGTKENLVKTIVEELHVIYENSFIHQKKLGRSGLKAIHGIADDILQFNKKNPEIAKGALILIYSATDPGNELLRREVAKLHKQLKDKFKEFIEEELAIFDGDATPIKNVDAFATLLLSCFRSISYLWLTNPEGTDLTALFEEFKAIATHSIRPDISSTT